MTPKERLHATIEGRPRDRAPVTPIVMAWAAHFVGKTYRDYYLNGKVMADSQIAVARAFDTEQVSAISDPWREASAFGMEFDWPAEGVGIPHGHLLNSVDDIRKLAPFDPHKCPRTRDRIDAVARMADQVGATHSVMGWIDGPLAVYVDLRGMEGAMIDLIEAPEAYERASAVLVESAIAFAKAQIDAGADFIGMGDAAASLIGPELYRTLVLPWERKVIAAIHAAGGGAKVKLHICGNIAPIIADIGTTGADLIDVDWMVPLEHARAAVGPNVALCGNFDPVAALLQTTPEGVARAVRDCLAKGGDRFVLQPGCEVPPGTPRPNLAAFCPGEGSLIREALRSKN